REFRVALTAAEPGGDAPTNPTSDDRCWRSGRLPPRPAIRHWRFIARKTRAVRAAWSLPGTTATCAGERCRSAFKAQNGRAVGMHLFAAWGAYGKPLSAAVGKPNKYNDRIISDWIY